MFVEPQTESDNISAAGFSPPPVVFCSPGWDFPWCSSTQQLLLIINIQINNYRNIKPFFFFTKSQTDKCYKVFPDWCLVCLKLRLTAVNIRRPTWLVPTIQAFWNKKDFSGSLPVLISLQPAAITLKNCLINQRKYFKFMTLNSILYR